MRSIQLSLKTDRFRLEPLAQSDLELCIQLYCNPQVMRFIRAPKSPMDVEREMPFICRRAGNGAIGVWSISSISDNEKIGTCVLVPLPIENNDIEWSKFREQEMPSGPIQVGYMLKPNYWGKGIATEVCKKLIQFGFEATHVKEIVAVIDADNDASKNVLIKSGLNFEGTRRAYNTDGVPWFRIQNLP